MGNVIHELPGLVKELVDASIWGCKRGCSIRPWIRSKHAVEGAVLLVHDDDMSDGIARTRGRTRLTLRITQRRGVAL
jgi:hypothetical protein